MVFFIGGCSDAPTIEQLVDPSTIQFSGEKALATLQTFVTQFPNRNSGEPNNEKAARWLKEAWGRMGLTTTIDRWSIINYNRPVSLKNVVAVLPGKSSKEIVIVAHFDQSPDTYEGADNDGSGMAILLQLSDIFSHGPIPEYTLVFLAADAEEYGMLGTLRFVETHKNTHNIIAGLSLDNVGKKFYNGLLMDPRGQFRGYGVLWFQLLAREAALSIADDWAPEVNPVINQVLDQAVPVSFMDEGPMVSAGIPSFGFTGAYPPESEERVWDTYHSPNDLTQYQSTESLGHVGRITEAIIRQCLAMDSFPEESGPYIYFSGSHKIFNGFPLWILWLTLPAGFFFISFRWYQKCRPFQFRLWKGAMIHFLSLWIPLILSVILTYFFVAIGWMDTYHLYPATSKDAAIYTPYWPVVILWVIGLSLMFWAGRTLEKIYVKRKKMIYRHYIKPLAWLVIGLCALWFFQRNPFSLILMVPLFAWYFISGRESGGRLADSLLFLSGYVLIFVLIYFFGFVIMKNGFSILWYLMMMFSIHMISLPMAAMIMAVITSGLIMTVNPPKWS